MGRSGEKRTVAASSVRPTHAARSESQPEGTAERGMAASSAMSRDARAWRGRKEGGGEMRGGKEGGAGTGEKGGGKEGGEGRGRRKAGNEWANGRGEVTGRRDEATGRGEGAAPTHESLLSVRRGGQSPQGEQLQQRVRGGAARDHRQGREGRAVNEHHPAGPAPAVPPAARGSPASAASKLGVAGTAAASKLGVAGTAASSKLGVCVLEEDGGHSGVCDDFGTVLARSVGDRLGDPPHAPFHVSPHPLPSTGVGVRGEAGGVRERGEGEG